MTYKAIFLLMLTLMLSACNNSLDDLNQFMAHEKSKPPKPIDPLPEVKPQQIFEYEAQNLRDPFSNDLELASDESLSEQQASITDGEGPDLTRRKEFLESYPLDSMIMVGTYQQGDDYWGLIIDPEGTVHRSSIGQFIGHNYGEIVSIQDDQIIIKEWINDGLGAWREREASMALREE